MIKTTLELTKFKLVISEDEEGIVSVTVNAGDKEIDNMTFDPNEFNEVEGGTQEEVQSDDETQKEEEQVQEVPQAQIENFSQFIAKQEKMNETTKK
jgi:hypothetical protein